MSRQLSHSEVLAFALAEAGLSHSAEEVQAWLDGDVSTMPVDLEPIIDGIFANIDYHVNCMKSRLLVDEEVVDEGLRSVASMPPVQLKQKAMARRKGMCGEATLHVKPMRLPQRTDSTLRSIAKGMGISTQSLIELTLEGLVDAVIVRTRGIGPKSEWKKAQRKLGANEVRGAIRRIRRSTDEQA